VLPLLVALVSVAALYGGAYAWADCADKRDRRQEAVRTAGFHRPPLPVPTPTQIAEVGRLLSRTVLLVPVPEGSTVRGASTIL
jgi:hypothetical protein